MLYIIPFTKVVEIVSYSKLKINKRLFIFSNVPFEIHLLDWIIYINTHVPHTHIIKLTKKRYIWIFKFIKWKEAHFDNFNKFKGRYHPFFTIKNIKTECLFNKFKRRGDYNLWTRKNISVISIWRGMLV